VTGEFFTTLQAVFDHTEQGQYDASTRKDTVADNDFGVRNSNGLMYDAMVDDPSIRQDRRDA